MQTRLMSLVESWANIIVGLGIALLTQVIAFPWFGIHIDFNANVKLSLIFTVVSLVRSYTLRRIFNHWRIR